MKRIFSLCAIAVATCGIAAWADSPTQNPISEQVTGQPIADCGDFLVLTNYRIEGFERLYFREDGSLSAAFYHVSYPDMIFFNANDESYWLAAKATGNENWAHFDDNGDIIWQARMGASTRVIVPGYGPVLIDVGRVVYDVNVGFTFMAGQHNQINGEVDALCAALRP